MSTVTRSGSKLFGQDIVQKASKRECIGVVWRCWHDEEVLQEIQPLDPLLRPLERGEVGVSFWSPNGTREILREDQLCLLDRVFQLGDYCKRSVEDLQSGVIVDVKVKGRFEHAISHQHVPGWFTTEDLKERTDAEIGDYVAYDDWIGQIVEVFDEYIIQLPSGQLVRMPELGSRLTVGDIGPHVLPPPDAEPHLSITFSMQERTGNATVLYVRQNTYAITWLALNQTLDPAISESKPRPQPFWYGDDLSKLSLILGPSVYEMKLGDRVEFRNPTGMPMTQHRQEGDQAGVFCVQMFRVRETETTVEVLWQDGSRETSKSTSLIPYLNPDEYDCWPGDHVTFKDEGTERPAIVQSVNAADRTASLLFTDTRSIEMATLLQLDTQGNPDETTNGPGSEVIGVNLGDFVFIHKIGETNASPGSRVPRIGEIESWVHEHAFDDEGELTGWRKAMHYIGSNIAAQRSNTRLVETAIRRPIPRSGELSWCGEVTALNLDGTVRVTHPDFSDGIYPLHRLTRMYDGSEQLENDLLGMGEGDDGAVENGWSTQTFDGDYLPMGGEQWDISEEDMSQDGFDEGQTGGDDINMGSVEDSVAVENTSVKDLATDIHVDELECDENPWSPFKFLPSAPVDHAFYTSPPAQPSKSFLSRLRRECSVLNNSLPDTILVRAYEDRTDLLRSLIIGPDNTPYADAPFLIDWLLDSDFPNSPPKAHFLSWTNGNGRVNPNLYEEGKVCLSLLGTWQGDRHEVWSPQRSSILQALISVQGLVLVKEPWFCEPAYEKLRGTPDATVNSRLYSEKAYILSRGFVARALERPLGSLEAEIKYLYYKQGRLQKVIDDGNALINKSRNSQDTSDQAWEKHAVPRLTTGGIIMLERILKKLVVGYGTTVG